MCRMGTFLFRVDKTFLRFLTTLRPCLMVRFQLTLRNRGGAFTQMELRMRNRTILPTILLAAIAASAVFSAAATETRGQGTGRDARTASRPNLNGIWQAMTTANWDLLTHDMRPAVAQPGIYPNVPVLAAPVLALGSFGGVPASIGVVEGNVIPYTTAAAAKKKENADHWLDRDPEIRCYMPGIPRAMYMPYPFQIVQGTNKIEMVFAFAGANRTIHLDKANTPPGDTWMGHSLGHWEGDTLVVNVFRFNDRTWFSRAGDFHSDALRLEERFTPITPDALTYEVTVEDPNVFTRPWKMKLVLYRQLEENAQLIEYKCTELVEETFLGHVRKDQLVKRWESDTMVIEVTRKIPPEDVLYQR